jgi:hypothetical protein
LFGRQSLADEESFPTDLQPEILRTCHSEEANTKPCCLAGNPWPTKNLSRHLNPGFPSINIVPNQAYPLERQVEKHFSKNSLKKKDK